jgi:hypothetical protein
MPACLAGREPYTEFAKRHNLYVRTYPAECVKIMGQSKRTGLPDSYRGRAQNFDASYEAG